VKVLLAPNAFKECLSAPQAAAAMAEGVRDADASAGCILCPIADGGDGTLEALLAATLGEKVLVRVSDPLGRPVEAPFGLLGGGDRAVIEMAEASGLRLLSAGERNPLIATTLGTGELMLAALERGVKSFIIGIGGSATVDGGTGMARALGCRFLDGEGRELPEGGGSLARLERIDAGARDARWDSVAVWIASDVTNPLLGDNGAARVYGPQKGATPGMVEQLEAGLSRLAAVIERDLGLDVRTLPGAGAAGGLGAGLMAFAGAQCRSGVELVLEESGFHEKLRKAGRVITGEGRVDRQTAFGKGPAGVARAAQASGVPVDCLAGMVEPGAEEELRKIGVQRTRCINPPGSSLEESLREAYPRLRRATAALLKNL
jgi:glycerate kinase